MLARCSHCGGEIRTETDDVFITCEYCRASVFIFPLSSGLRYILRPVADSQKAELIIKNFFLKKGYTGEIHIAEKDAVLFPFYREENQNQLIPAIKDSNFNLISGLRFKGGELVFYDEAKTGDYRILEPEIEPDEIKDRKVNLIYYPLIFVTYKYLGQEYRLLIDGFSEEIYADILPVQRDTVREKAYIYVFIITAFLLFIEFFAFESFLVSFILAISTLLVIWFFFPSIFRLIEDIYVSEDQNSKMS